MLRELVVTHRESQVHSGEKVGEKSVLPRPERPWRNQRRTGEEGLG